MGIFKHGVMIGAALAEVVIFAMAGITDRDYNHIDIVVDTEKKKAAVKIAAHAIPYENFKVFTRLEKGKVYLYIRGAVVNDNTEIITLSYKFRVKNIDMSDFKNMIWHINEEDDLVVEIPISVLQKGAAIKKVR